MVDSIKQQLLRPKWIAGILCLVALGIILSKDDPKVVLPVIGIASFAIPIILSFDDEYNLGTRLDSGEVRKSIAIALTVVYIIMLTLFFVNVHFPQDSGNATSEVDQTKSGVSSPGTSPLILPLLIQPAGAEENSNSKNNSINNTEDKGDAPPSDQDEPKSDEAAGKNENEAGNCTNTTLVGGIPREAIKDIYTNFLYVYILIISFYFGSRVFEDFTAVRMTKELRNFDSVDLLKKKFALGEISYKDFEKRIEMLKEPMNQEPQNLAFYFDSAKKRIRIVNMSNKEVGLKDLYIGGIRIYDKLESGKKTIKATEYLDIEVEDITLGGQPLPINVVTDSGSMIKDLAIAAELVDKKAGP